VQNLRHDSKLGNGMEGVLQEAWKFASETLRSETNNRGKNSFLFFSSLFLQIQIQG
jgi:hypothetical protein